VVQKLYASALRDAVADDPMGYGTLYPASNRALPDLSATPNRLLQSHIVEQASVEPGTLAVAAGAAGPQKVAVRLLARPAAAVAINATAAAAWDGAPLAAVEPAVVQLGPQDWDAGGGAAAAEFTVTPRDIGEGQYFIQFDFS
jgi:hypothetical protein